MRARDVLELPLDAERHVLFGPHGNGGVVVVNRAARELFHELAQPRTLADVVASGQDPDPASAVLTRLLEHDLIHPPDAEPAPQFRKSTELTVWLHITNACNLRCPYCYVHKSSEAMDDATARATVDALVRSALDNEFRSMRLKYAGGEASLNTAVLFAMHDYAVTRCAESGLGLSTVLLSNGVAISERLARELAEREVAVMVSLDGLGAAHDTQRPTLSGRPSSPMVVRSI
ncbi:MAG: radical SAM protein, partial [Actinobacteria bacterium]|nr:radical SAM protein [Actinomycetota bacterium]